MSEADVEILERAELIRSVHDGQRMDVVEFGRALLTAQDLDPVYVLLWEAMKNADMRGDLLFHWLLAYWCFYHVGTASWIASGYQPEELDEDGDRRDWAYWVAMETAAKSKDFPRSRERRHFRGKNAEASVNWLHAQGVGSLFEPLIDHDHHVRWITQYVETWVGFGPWIAFKVADMVERLGLSSVTFDIGTVMYDSPASAAQLLWETEGRPESELDSVEGVKTAIGEWAIRHVLSGLAVPKSNNLRHVAVFSQTPLPDVPKMSRDAGDNAEIDEFRGRLAGFAPPRYDRPLGMQEAETVLCKWKSYLTGHYHIGEDVAGCRSGLLRFAKCRIAQQLLRAGKRGGLWL